jgi:hypothetical protein
VTGSGAWRMGVAVAACVIVECLEPLDDRLPIGIGEVAHAAALAQLALVNVRQPIRQRVEAA